MMAVVLLVVENNYINDVGSDGHVPESLMMINI